MSPRQRAYYHGVALAPYDLVREGLIGIAVVGALVCGLAVALSSPDQPPLTVQHVATTAPLTFLQTALGELDGTDSINSYGPPYNGGTGSVQSLGPVSFQRLAGVHIPIDTAQDMVLGPLRRVAQMEPPVAAALQTFDHASPARRSAWEAAYGTALGAAHTRGASVRLPAGAYGPVGPLLAGLLTLGRSGLLEPAVDNSPRIYSTDNTRSILFLQAAAPCSRRASLAADASLSQAALTLGQGPPAPIQPAQRERQSPGQGTPRAIGQGGEDQPGPDRADQGRDQHQRHGRHGARAGHRLSPAITSGADGDGAVAWAARSR